MYVAIFTKIFAPINYGPPYYPTVRIVNLGFCARRVPNNTYSTVRSARAF